MPVLLALGLLALAALPWYGEGSSEAALTLAFNAGRWWLAPPFIGWLLVLVGWRLQRTSAWHGSRWCVV